MLKAIENIRSHAASSNDAPITIIRATKRQLEQETKLLMPSDTCLSQIIKRQRTMAPDETYSGIAFAIPRHVKYLGPEKFIIGDSYNEENDERLIIFSTKRLMEMLQSSDILIIDGTFKVAPVGFSQLYTVHAGLKINGNYISASLVS